MYTDALQCGVCSVCRKWLVFVFVFCVFVGILIYSDTATHCIQCMQLGCYVMVCICICMLCICRYSYIVIQCYSEYSVCTVFTVTLCSGGAR